MGNENNSLKYSSDRKDENDTKHAAYISESATDKMYNSIVRIENGNLVGTGFFMKINLDNKIKYFLFTCRHIINDNDIESKKEIRIFHGKKSEEKSKSIKLDKDIRFITSFSKGKDVSIIEVLKEDKIPENKFLIPDLSYKYGYDDYKNGKFILAGYPNDEIYQKERHISSGEIKEINDFEFNHTLDTRSGSSGAPICLLNNIQVIGIHKQGHKYKPINYGTFIGKIIDELENNYKGNNIKNNIKKKEKNNKDLLISNIELIKKIENEVCFKELIILYDERLCSLDDENIIKIYDNMNFNTQIVIENKEKISNGIFHLECMNNNILAIITDISIKLLKINSNNFNIIKDFSLDEDKLTFSSNYSSVYNIDDKIYFDTCCVEKFGNDYVLKKLDSWRSCLYKEKFKFKEREITIWTEDEEHYFVHLESKNKNKTQEYITNYFNNDLTRNQKLLIEPSYVILGQNEFLFDLSKNSSDYMNYPEDDFVIQKRAFKRKEKSNRSFYQNLNKDSFLYMEEDSYLYQIKISTVKRGFNFEIVQTRDDIKGKYFLYHNEKIFVLNEKNICVYKI